MANKFHTCSLISIFAQVHAPVENGFDFIRRYGGELCEALFCIHIAPASSRSYDKKMRLFFAKSSQNRPKIFSADIDNSAKKCYS